MRSRWLFGLGLLWLVLSTVILGYEIRRRPQIIIQWVTETEVNTAGFNLYRADSESGPFERINGELVFGQGDPLTGATYEFVDSNVARDRTYFYKLEEVEVDGRINPLELIQAEAQSTQPWLLVLAGMGVLVGGYLLVAGRVAR
jgi:hypothetical protein